MVTTLFLSTIMLLVAIVAVLATLAIIHLVMIAVQYALHLYKRVTKRE